MSERDEEGRPVAEHNAGAFLGPAGMIPAPSSLLREPPADAWLDRDDTGGHARVGAIITAVSIWALFGVGFRFVLAATEPWAELEPIVVGHHMTRLMHEDVVGFLAHAMMIVVGTRVGMRQARLTGWRSWTAIITGAVIGAAAVSLGVAVVGDLGAAFIAGMAVVWLVAGDRRRI